MSDRYGTPARPDDIPESVWNSCWWAQAHGLQEAASRHIMAAKVEEREACAKHIEEDMYTDQDIEDEPTDFRAAYNRALKRQANRVRSRT